MTTSAPGPSDDPAKTKGAGDFNPEDYRMSVGEHLEELRSRLIKGLLGFFVAVVFCFIFAKGHIIPFFLHPLSVALVKNNIPPQAYYSEAAEPFMVYIEISLIVAAAIASPWLIYQLWQFVGAGLYPAERKYVTKYLPLSILLLISGMAFLYTYVLPISVEFFFHFGDEIPFNPPHAYVEPSRLSPTTQHALVIPRYDRDPENAVEGQLWLDLAEKRLKVFVDGEAHIINYAPPNGISPMITLSKYIDMVVGMLLAFGISFQLPLVVLALHKIGIVDIATLKNLRRYVYFAMSIVAACIIPDVVTGMIALMVPLILLYELGIFLAWWSERKAPKEA